MPRPRFYPVNLESLNHVGGEIFQLDAGIAALMLLAWNEHPEGVGRNRYALPRQGRKADRRLGRCRRVGQTGGKKNPRNCTARLVQKPPSSRRAHAAPV